MAAPVNAAAATKASSPTIMFFFPRSIPQQVPADDQSHHLVGALENLVHAQIPQNALDGMIAQIAVAAVKLQAAIDHVEAGIGRKALGHGRKAGGTGVAQ